jgi:hypothetical protein
MPANGEQPRELTGKFLYLAILCSLPISSMPRQRHDHGIDHSVPEILGNTFGRFTRSRPMLVRSNGFACRTCL